MCVDLLRQRTKSGEPFFQSLRGPREAWQEVDDDAYDWVRLGYIRSSRWAGARRFNSRGLTKKTRIL